MSSDPWMKFYPQDWRADEKLRLCSLAARGLWIEMLAIMHRSERYGHLLISGRVPTDAQLAVQVGALPTEVTALLSELDIAGVFSRAVGGAIYSRRMTRDDKKAKTAAKNGKAGGNPTLRKQRDNPALDNPKDKGQVKGEDKAQKPEARSQKETPNPLSLVAKGGGWVDLLKAWRTCREEAGWPEDQAIMRGSDGPRKLAMAWSDLGVTAEMMLGVVRPIVAAVKDKGADPIGSLHYFDRAIRQAADLVKADAEVAAAPSFESLEGQWIVWMPRAERYRKNRGSWHALSMGAEPGERGCQMPTALQEYALGKTDQTPQFKAMEAA